MPDLQSMSWNVVHKDVVERLHTKGRIHVTRAAAGWVITVHDREPVQFADLASLKDHFQPSQILVSAGYDNGATIIEMLF